ncbi:MAG: DUF3445 domain-containing protein [Polyangiaceae bacterium]|nr:DUF3445 domain-containing protein [Polyangiaceae bacterium]
MVFLQGPWKLSMGLNALDPADWLWVDDRFAAETVQRAALIAERPNEVHAMLPGAEDAARELLALVREHLAGRALPPVPPLPATPAPPPVELPPAATAPVPTAPSPSSKVMSS